MPLVPRSGPLVALAMLALAACSDVQAPLATPDAGDRKSVV